MFLTIGPYLGKKVGNSIGQVAAFSVGKRTGVVLQYVKHTTKLDDEHSTERFTEAWPVRNGKIKPEGKDYFLTPIQWVLEVDGSIKIDARMWFVEGDPTAIMRACKIKHGQVDIAGTLPAREGQVPVQYRPNSGSLRRIWSATWKKTRYKKDVKSAIKYKHKTTMSE